MKNAGWLQDSDFVSAVGALPLVSIDLVLVNPEGELLLGLRRNAPARHWWFTPGGRVRKHEPFAACMERIAASELGLPSTLLKDARLMGVWDHFYDDSAFSPDVSTHYVNLPHCLQLQKPLDASTLPLDQHTAWRWQNAQAAAVAEDVHPHVRAYAQWVAEHVLG
jgi:colanic acid biosynthesis protein WcaH